MGVRLTVRMPEALRRALDERAERERRDAGEVVRLALEAYLGVEPRERPSPRRSAVGEAARPTHRHRFERTGEFRFVAGRKVHNRACECGETRWEE